MTEVGSFTRGATGSATILLNNSFIPSIIEFDISARFGTNEVDVRRSSGWTDGTRKRTMSIYASSTLRGTRETNSYAITHYVDVSGTLTKKISGNVTAMGLGQFDVNFDTVDSNYTIAFKAWS